MTEHTHAVALPATGPLVALLVALLLGAAVATGIWALTDDTAVAPAAEVIVVNPSDTGSDEAATATAISPQAAPEVQPSLTRDEAVVAAAVGSDGD